MAPLQSRWRKMLGIYLSRMSPSNKLSRHRPTLMSSTITSSSDQAWNRSAIYH